MSTQNQPSLYDRLGGVYSIATVVDDLIDRIMVDSRLNANPRVDEAHHRVSPAGFKYLVTEQVGEAMGHRDPVGQRVGRVRAEAGTAGQHTGELVAGEEVAGRPLWRSREVELAAGREPEARQRRPRCRPRRPARGSRRRVASEATAADR